jgi:hypothetical protein
MQKQGVNSAQANNSTLSVRAIPHKFLIDFIDKAVGYAEDRPYDAVEYDSEYEDAEGMTYQLYLKLVVNGPYRGKGPRWVDVYQCHVYIYDQDDNEYTCSVSESELARAIEQMTNRSYEEAYGIACTYDSLRKS